MAAVKVAPRSCRYWLRGRNSKLLWAELGHNVHALDVNQPLLELARRRAGEQGRLIDFQLGSATAASLGG